MVKEEVVCPQIEKWPEVHASDWISSHIRKQCIMKLYASWHDSEMGTEVNNVQLQASAMGIDSDRFLTDLWKMLSKINI